MPASVWAGADCLGHFPGSLTFVYLKGVAVIYGVFDYRLFTLGITQWTRGGHAPRGLFNKEAWGERPALEVLSSNYALGLSYSLAWNHVATDYWSLAFLATGVGMRKISKVLGEVESRLFSIWRSMTSHSHPGNRQMARLEVTRYPVEGRDCKALGPPLACGKLKPYLVPLDRRWAWRVRHLSGEMVIHSLC